MPKVGCNIMNKSWFSGRVRTGTINEANMCMNPEMRKVNIMGRDAIDAALYCERINRESDAAINRKVKLK